MYYELAPSRLAFVATMIMAARMPPAHSLDEQSFIVSPSRYSDSTNSTSASISSSFNFSFGRRPWRPSVSSWRMVV